MQSQSKSSGRYVHSRLALLGVLAIYLFSPPLISINRGYLFGVPTIFVYFFSVWFILILFAYIMQRQNRRNLQLVNSVIENNNNPE